MDDVQELQLVLTVSDFEAAVALYRDALGLAELEDWSDGDARTVRRRPSGSLARVPNRCQMR